MRKLPLGKMSAFGAAVIAAAVYVHWLNVPPAVTIPQPVLPSPNGRDALHNAYKLLKYPNDVDRAWPKVSFDGYDMSSLLKGSDARAVMADNAAALRATRKAMALPYWNATNRSEGNEGTEYADIQALAHFLGAESEARASRGDYDGAVNSSLDALALGDLLRHGGGLLATRNGCQIESLAAQQVWSLIEKLDRSGAAKACKRLAAMRARRFPLSAAMIQEKWLREERMLGRLRHESTFTIAGGFVSEDDEACSDSGNSDCRTASHLVGAYKSLLGRSKREFFAEYVSLLDTYIAESKARYSRPAASSDPPLANPALYGVSIRDFEDVRLDDARTRAELGLVECALAIRTYKTCHGQNPHTLLDLRKEGESDDLPEDPFAHFAGTTFRYLRRDADNFILYSVGPDGSDDAGTPVGWSKENPCRSDLLFQVSKGDWVAGSNFPHWTVDIGKG